MSNLTTRAGKGSPLTNNELDANFTNLNSDKVEIGGDLSGTSSAPNVAKIQGRAVSSDAPAAGEKLVWNGTAWEPSADPSGEPIGHADKSQSSISFNNGNRTFSISPVSTSFDVWCKGVKYTYSTAQSVVIPNTTGLHFIYFSASGVLSTQMSYFTWEEHAPTAYVYWNSTTQQAIYFGDERHGITLDWQTHEYLHRTRGAAIANGFAASGYTTTGLGATDADAQIDIGGGTFFDEDMQVDIVSTNTPVAGTWQQDLSGPALIPVLYLSGSAWVIDAPTNFPFKVVSGVPQYNLFSGGTWSTAPVTNNEYFVSWILATNNLTHPVIAIISQAPTNQLSAAEAMTFEGLNLNGFPSVEFRPLYKVIYQYKTGFTNSVKSSTIAVYDLRSLQSAGVAAALVQDHGNLSGLGDDDHAQYLHVSEVRSPSSAVKNSFLPTQAGQSGKYLTTDGSNPSWGAIPSGSLSFTGDVTGSGTTGSSTTLTLSNSGATAGTYSKVTVDAKGRVTTGALISNTDVTTALGFTPENSGNKGVANGYASLDGSGKVPSTQLPSYVDDVLEYANLAALPGTGESGKIYITIDTAKTYRWSGSAYVEISASPGSTDAVPEGSTNLYFTNSRARGAITATGSLSYNNSTGVLSYTQPTNVSTFSNDSGYLTGITGAQVTTALGYTPLSTAGGTLTGGLAIGGNLSLGNNAIVGVDSLTFNDPGPGEGLTWSGGNAWRLYESPNDLTTNTGGNIQFVQNGVRRATFNTSGQLELPIATGTAPFLVSSTTRVANLNVATAGTADALTTARTINGVSFDGTANITVADSTKLPLSGGTLTGKLTTTATSDWTWQANNGTNNWGIGPSGTGFTIGTNYFLFSSSGASVNSELILERGTTKLLEVLQANLQYKSNIVLHAGNYNSYALPLSGGTLTGTLTVGDSSGGNIAYADSGGTYIPRPGGGSYKTTGSTQTGAVAIQLPTALYNQSDMISFWVDIYDYSGNESVSLFIFGYAYGSNTGQWTNVGATILSPRTDRDYTVRFCNDGTRHVVCIGETNSTWSYAQIVVRDVQAGYSASASTLTNGWGVTFLTTLPTVMASTTSNYPTADQLFGNSRQLVASGATWASYDAYSADNNESGMRFYDSAGGWRATLYGNGTAQGFLQSSGTWDLQKAVNGELDIRISGTDRRVLHAANYNSYSPTLTGTGASGTWGISISGSAAQLGGNSSSAYSGPASAVKQFFWSSLGASSTQARTFEIARLGIDFNDWNSVGPFEVELFENYYSNGLKKKYVISYGYSANQIQLVEYSGSGENNFRVRIGSPVQVSGDQYYLPVFVDVRYYSGVSVRVTTNRNITASNPPGIGQTFINASPSATNISDFTADSTVNFASTTAVQINGNQLLHAANYNSYSPTLTGTGASGTWGISVTGSAGAVGWANVTSGTRTGHGDIRFQPPASSYAGIQFLDTGGNAAGWFLIRGTSDTDVYTAEGITLVADKGWLTLAQRETSGRGVRLMSGVTSTERLKITTAGDIQFVNGNSFTYGGNAILHAGNYSSYALPLSGGTLTGMITFPSGSSYQVLAPGSGTYNKHVQYISSTEYTLEAAMATDSISGTKLPITFTWRGGYAATGGLKITGSAAAALGGNAILHAGNYSSYALPLSGGTLTGDLLWSGIYPKIGINDGGADCYIHITDDNPTHDGVGYGGEFFFYGDKSVSASLLRAGGAAFSNAPTVNGNKTLHAGNYTSYSPSLTGSGASGTWSINVTGTSAALSGGDSGFYGLLYNGVNGDLNTYNSPGLYSAEYTGSTNKPSGANNGHWIQISDAGGTDVKTQWYLNNNGASIWMRLMWGNGNWQSWRSLLHDGNYSSYALPLSGGTVSGALSFGSSVRQMINLWGTQYGIGVQSSTTYFRSNSRFSWHRGGSHNDAENNPGGGTVAMTLDGSSNLTVTANVTAYSDERVKANWRHLDDGFVVKLAGVKSGIYDRTDAEITQVGVSAQSLRDVLPHAVIESDDGDLSVAYGNAAMVSAVELAKEIVNLKREIEMLKSKLH